LAVMSSNAFAVLSILSSISFKFPSCENSFFGATLPLRDEALSARQIAAAMKPCFRP